MANKLDNLMPIEEVNSRRTPEQHSEDSRKAGIRSGEVRRQRATMLQTLEMLLESTNTKTGKTYRELSTLGLINGAVKGNAQNYRMMLEMLGELKELEENRQEKEITKVEELLQKITDEACK